MTLVLSEEMASDLRGGAIYECSGAMIGLRKVRRVWFNPASGHYVADCGGMNMWTDEPYHDWRCVPARTAWNMRADALQRQMDGGKG